MQRTYVRRRRTLAAAASLVLLLTVGSPAARAFGGADAPAVSAATYVVQAGDTLWSIAEGHAPGEDPRAVVHEIVRTNDLDDGPLVPGRSLALPDVG